MCAVYSMPIIGDPGFREVGGGGLLCHPQVTNIAMSTEKKTMAHVTKVSNA